MAEYEVVREIANNCSRNQMRDVFFEEVETDDPEGYVRSLIQSKELHLEQEELPGGGRCIYAECDGLFQKFLFTPL